MYVNEIHKNDGVGAEYNDMALGWDLPEQRAGVHDFNSLSAYFDKGILAEDLYGTDGA